MSDNRRPPSYRADKFGELILYISRRCEGDDAFAATKLNKLLYYSDFRAYARFGKPITGATYQKIKFGPAPRQYLPTVERLIANGDAELEHRNHHSRQQDRLTAKRDANLALFAPRELALVDKVIQEFWGRNAKPISEDSHRETGWRLAKLGETIPYWSVFIDLERQPSTDDVAWTKGMGADPRALQVQ
jgi:Protein of unknown function (DUF4065)